MNSIGMLLAQVAFDMLEFPTVDDVLAGRYTPKGNVRLVIVKGDAVGRTPPVDSATLDWNRLMRTAKIEEVP